MAAAVVFMAAAVLLSFCLGTANLSLADLRTAVAQQAEAVLVVGEFAVYIEQPAHQVGRQFARDAGLTLKAHRIDIAVHRNQAAIVAALKLAIKEKKTGVIITGIIGVVMALAFLVLLLVPIPMFACSLSKQSYICLLIWILLGLVFYLSSKKNRVN